MRKRILAIAAGFTVLALGFLIYRLDIPGWQQLDLEKIRRQPESTLVFDGNGECMGALYALHPRAYTELEEIPDHVLSAFITAEDQRFFRHRGIDVRRIFGALWHDLKSRSLEQGASTITQQLIKLTHLNSEKTLSRKLQEAMLAIRLERRLEKNEILEAYLNTVYFGGGAYGVGTAARAFFGKPVQDLSIAEGALLAGVIKSPANYSPRNNPENALERRNRILNAMLENGAISAAEHAQATNEALSLAPERQEHPDYGWFMDQVMDEAEAALGMQAEEIISSGFRIHTGFRPEIQSAADRLFENGANFPDPAADGTPVQAAFVALDVHTGEIAAIVGGREYEVRRGLNRAVQMQRQPGSAIKPVSTYAAALEKHRFLPTSTVMDVQREFPGKYLPGNAGGNYYGEVTLREALSRSLNVATVDLADLIGMQSVRETIAGFGLPLAPEDVNLSLALGSMTDGVSPAQLCAAYCALANGGMQTHAHAIRRITDSRGKIIYEAPAEQTRAVKEETAFLIADMLKTAASEGSAKALANAGMPVMGKTGTVGEESGGNRDIWTVAATPEIAMAVWMGFDEPGPGRAMPDSAGGSSYPARFCATLLEGIRGSLNPSDFAPPDGLEAVEIDRAALEENGAVMLAAPNTPGEYRQREWFPKGRAPETVSTLWNAPERVEDLMLLSEKGEPPALAFTSRDGAADYLVLRRHGDETDIAAVLRADAGHVIVWSEDVQSAPANSSYSILPRHRLLYESGTLLVGPESSAVFPAGAF